MPPSTKSITYSDAVRALNSDDVRGDLEDASQQLSLSAVKMIEAFGSIAKQLHTIDLQGLTPGPPLKPQWNSLSTTFSELIQQLQGNARFISARLKMFCTVVLPLTARNSTGSRSHDEKLQVLQSYMSISSDHAVYTQKFVGCVMEFNKSLNLFHTEFSRSVSQRSSSGQRELRELTQKLSDLENNVKQLCLANGKSNGVDITHFVFTVLRISSSCRRKPSRARLSHQRLVLNSSELATVGRLCEQLDRTRNEVAHAQYTSQVCHRKTDVLATTQTTISTLVSDEMMTLEPVLSLFLSIWSRLHSDCADILHWLQNSRSHSDMPVAITSLLDGGDTLYSTIAYALEIMVMGIDSSHPTNKT